MRRAASLADLHGILEKNREWAESKVANDPEYFQRLVNTCTPDWMWIGCADSRVPANELLGLGPGEVLVQRNVGNLASHKDPNCMSSLEYAVSVLKVKHVLVCGHYGCGAVRAALTIPCKTQGLVNLWIQDIRDTRDRHVVLLHQLHGEARVDKLVELNTLKQVLNVCTSPVVQNAWDQGQRLAIHGLVYRPTNGVLKELTPTITSLDEFESFSANRLIGLQRASLGVLDSGPFEPEALRKEQSSTLPPAFPFLHSVQQAEI